MPAIMHTLASIATAWRTVGEVYTMRPYLRRHSSEAFIDVQGISVSLSFSVSLFPVSLCLLFSGCLSPSCVCQSRSILPSLPSSVPVAYRGEGGGGGGHGLRAQALEGAPVQLVGANFNGANAMGPSFQGPRSPWVSFSCWTPFFLSFFCLSIVFSQGRMQDIPIKRGGGGRRSKHWPPGAGNPRDATSLSLYLYYSPCLSSSLFPSLHNLPVLYILLCADEGNAGLLRDSSGSIM